VKGLSHLVVPLTNYSNAIEGITEQKIFETNRYLQKAASLTTSYNYNHLFSTKIFENLFLKIHESSQKRKDKNLPKLTNIGNLPSKQLQTAHQILLTWLHSISLNATEYLEPTSGQSINYYLPMHQPVETIADLRNGKLLTRVIVCLIFDRVNLRNQAEKGVVNLNASYYQLWTKNTLTFEDIQKLQELEVHSLELLTFILHLATTLLEIPSFKPMDIFSGKSDIIFHFVVCLMNASIPMVNKTEKDYFEKKISLYYQIVNELQALKQEKAAILTTVFHERNNSFDRELDEWNNTANSDIDSNNMEKKKLAVKKHTVKRMKIDEGDEEKDSNEDDEQKNHLKSKSRDTVDGGGEGKLDDEGENVGGDENMEESVEIRHKSMLDQLYDFFLEESSTRRSKLFEEEQQRKSMISIDSQAVVTEPGLLLGTRASLDGTNYNNNNPHQLSRSLSRSISNDTSTVDGTVASAIVLPPPMTEKDLLQEEKNNQQLQNMKHHLDSFQRLPKIQYSLEMSDASYDQLCKILDEFIVSKESSQILEYSEKTFVISEKLAELQVAVSLMRDHRDEGIRLTTDIRQFITSQAMKIAIQQLRLQEANNH
jgi:hypothetical protein